MQVCTSLHTDNHASTQPLSFLHVGCPPCCPTNSVKAVKACTEHMEALLSKYVMQNEHVFPAPLCICLCGEAAVLDDGWWKAVVVFPRMRRWQFWLSWAMFKRSSIVCVYLPMTPTLSLSPPNISSTTCCPTGKLDISSNRSFTLCFLIIWLHALQLCGIVFSSGPPGHNVPLIRFLILELYIFFLRFSLLIFSFTYLFLCE